MQHDHDPMNDFLSQVFAPWTQQADVKREIRLIADLLKDMQGRLARHDRLINKMEKNMATTQADLDALAAALGDLSTKLTSADEGLQAEIDALQAANPSLDLSGVQSALGALSAQVDATAAMVPAAPPADVPPADGGDVPAE
jgi:cytochrome c556